VTQNADGSLGLEPINDASGVTYSANGIYHVWHQCCQNHWDHVISRDLIHWQRLPPPVQPVTLKTWDGSITMLPAEVGGPIMLYDAQDGKVGSHGQDPRGPMDRPVLGVARLVDPANDAYLMTWSRAAFNPVNQTGKPTDFPSQIWKSGDHYNFVGEGSRYQFADPTFQAATNVDPLFIHTGAHSGQWWIPTPNQADGSPPPPGAPNTAVNVGGGATYLLGDYNHVNETFTPWAPAGTAVVASLEGGHADWWGGQGGADNNNRMMIIGWAMPDFNGDAGPGIKFLTRLTLLREVNWDADLQTLVSNPVPELVGLRNGTVASERGVALGAAAHAVGGTGGGAAASADILITFSGVNTSATATFGACVLSNGTLGSGLGVAFSTAGGPANEWYMPGVDLPGGDYNVTDVEYSDPHICQAACGGDARCKAFTYVTRPPKVGSCCLKDTAPNQFKRPTCTSGVKPGAGPGPTGKLTVRVGSCAPLLSGELAATAPGRDLDLAPGAPVALRVLPDRSVADFFVNGGAFAGTTTWPDKAPRAPGDSQVLLVAPAGTGVSADVDVFSMGCGWVDPSYTEHPTL
jgi:hypothetical protein